MEHVRMRLTHEPAVSDAVDVELLEFRFIFDRSALSRISRFFCVLRQLFYTVHHDNRDFTILPDHQPRGQSFDLQTVLGGIHPAVRFDLIIFWRSNSNLILWQFGWLEVWLKIYIRALAQASDYDENIKNKTVDPLYLKLVPQVEDPRPLQERIANFPEEELKEVLSPFIFHFYIGYWSLLHFAVNARREVFLEVYNCIGGMAGTISRCCTVS